MTEPSILWLCRDFRLDDNVALVAAAVQGPVLPVFVHDAATDAQGSASRWRLERALRTFDAAWHRRTGQRLTIMRGEPADLLPGLAAQIGAVTIHQNDWPAPAQRRVQAALRAALKDGPVQLCLHEGHLLLHPSRVKTGAGTTYRVYTPFARAARAAGPDSPVAAPGNLTALPAIGPLRVADLALAPDMHSGAAVLAEHALPVGEGAAYDRLDAFLDHAKTYPTDRDRPDIDATSGMSDYLALGEISPRRIWSTASMHAEAHPAQAAGIEKFLSEVLWREFAWHLLLEFPQMASKPWRGEWADFPWHKASAASRAWVRAETGIALVDAGLREMRVTGRMHNRVRMVVASWLTKHLLTDWRVGLRHFEDSLTDWDPASNAMNWQWVAGCGPDASPFFRIFNPVKQAETFDPKARYRDHWLRGDGARAYRDTVPSSWDRPAKWRPAETAELLADGRARALGALERFNDKK